MWIITDIERRLKLLGLRPKIFAVTPAIEKLWPADEFIEFAGKLVGLQVKRPAFDLDGTQDIGLLKWSLDSPVAQAIDLMKFTEIYYCLPTFLNREVKELAADHSIFWRPTQDPPPKGAWYNNARAQSWVNDVGVVGMRWGHFVEGLLNCSIGRRFARGELRSLLNAYGNSLEARGDDLQSEDFLFYGIAIPFD